MLTPKQQEVLDYLKGYIKEHGIAPSRQEIADNFGFHPTGALSHLKALEKKGYIELIPKIARGIVIINDWRELV